MDKLWLKLLTAAIVIGAVWYIFTPNDIIPEGIFGPLGTITAYIDDAIVVGGAIFLLKRITSQLYRTKDTGTRYTGIAITALVVAGALFYLFWGQDLIPDSVPIFGRLDDISVVLVALRVLIKWKQPGEA